MADIPTNKPPEKMRLIGTGDWGDIAERSSTNVLHGDYTVRCGPAPAGLLVGLEFADLIPVAPWEAYRVEVYASHDDAVNPHFCNVAVSWYDSAKTFISTQVSSRNLQPVSSPVAIDDDVLVSNVRISPSNAAFALVSAYTSSNPTYSLYIDKLDIQRVPGYWIATHSAPSSIAIATDPSWTVITLDTLERTGAFSDFGKTVTNVVDAQTSGMCQCNCNFGFTLSDPTAQMQFRLRHVRFSTGAVEWHYLCTGTVPVAGPGIVAGSTAFVVEDGDQLRWQASILGAGTGTFERDVSTLRTIEKSKITLHLTS